MNYSSYSMYLKIAYGKIVLSNLPHLAQYWKQICNHIDNKIDKDLKCKYKHKTWQDINITTIVFLYIRSYAKLVPHQYTQKNLSCKSLLSIFFEAHSYYSEDFVTHVKTKFRYLGLWNLRWWCNINLFQPIHTIN